MWCWCSSGHASTAGVRALRNGTLQSRLRYWRRLILVFLAVLLPALLLIPVGLGFMTTHELTQGTCVVLAPPTIPHDEVTFPSGDLTLTAYFIPGDSDAAVIIAPPLNHDHGGQLDYAGLLNEAGLNVLVMGSRLCAGEPSSFGYTEGDDVTAAYAYLVGRGDINPERVSAHGFSAAGAAALFGTARTPQIKAVSAMGNYHDFEQSIGVNRDGAPFVEQLYITGLVWGFRVGAGVPISALKPVDIIDEINPRPILLVYGTLEPLIDGRILYEAAENGTLWEVEGVGHGGYMQAYPDEAREIIAGFHVAALLEEDE
ncbi:MAG: hypothetical protein AAFR22_24765 [Chloroflexota bacterium]